jgi:hypothetical protein
MPTSSLMVMAVHAAEPSTWAKASITARNSSGPAP